MNFKKIKIKLRMKMKKEAAQWIRSQSKHNGSLTYKRDRRKRHDEIGRREMANVAFKQASGNVVLGRNITVN